MEAIMRFKAQGGFIGYRWYYYYYRTGLPGAR